MSYLSLSPTRQGLAQGLCFYSDGLRKEGSRAWVDMMLNKEIKPNKPNWFDAESTDTSLFTGWRTEYSSLSPTRQVLIQGLSFYSDGLRKEGGLALIDMMLNQINQTDSMQSAHILRRSQTEVLNIHHCLRPDRIWHKVFFIVGILEKVGSGIGLGSGIAGLHRS